MRSNFRPNVQLATNILLVIGTFAIALKIAPIANYTIEGHVPIESINKLFIEKPNINGIAVPGMPIGSPGMEMHSHQSHSHDYENYKVVSFSKTGKTKIFDKISP